MTACGARWCKAVPTSEVRNPGRRQAGVFYSPIPVIPRNAGWDIGPLIVGACEGDASGAGLRFSKAVICGAGFVRKAGLTPWPPRPPPEECPMPPRAKPEVEPATQATAHTTAKRRFIIQFLLLMCLLGTSVNHPTRKRLCPCCLNGLVLRCMRRPKFKGQPKRS